ncbi:MAG TPA: thioredoxin domain-containing protein [Polyangiaceae bacterium]|nr:thioredoxin domain-containing protein [Polyangiaceae bacterium]
MLRPGMALGQFDLTEPVVEDGITAVWRARRRATGEPCTVEALAPALAGSLPARSAFLAAAGAITTASLDRRLLRVLDVGEDAAAGVPFVVTADDPGPTLAARLRGRGPLSRAETASLVRNLAELLGGLHPRGLAHGELAPRNLVLPEGPGAEVAVRGLVRGPVIGQRPAAEPGSASPYVAPELRGGGARPTPAGDVYGLAQLALSVLTGVEPSGHREEAAAPGAALRPSAAGATAAERLPPGFDDWFLAATTADPSGRPPFEAAARALVELLTEPRAGRAAGTVALGAVGVHADVPAKEPGAPATPPWDAPAPTGPAWRGRAPRDAPEPRSPWDEEPAAVAPAAPRDGSSSTLIVVAVIVSVSLLVLAVFGVIAGAGLLAYFSARRAAVTAAASASAAAPTGEPPPAHQVAAVPVSADDPVQGSQLAPVTVVVFNDLQCPFCKRLAPTLAELRREFGDDTLRVVHKQFPLSFHGNAEPAQQAAIATFLAAGGGAPGSEAFARFQELAFANQTALEPKSYELWAVQAGADAAAYRRELAGPRPREKVAADMALGQRIGVRGTPNCFVNGILVSGAQPAAKFRETIEAELTAVKALVASGTAPELVYPARVGVNFQAPSAATATATATAAADDTTIWRVEVAPDDPSLGPADALVTLVEWSDFQCPFCKRASDTLVRLRENHPADLRLVWKDNPLPFHARAKPAAVLARLAFERQGSLGFFRAHDALFASAPALEDADLARVAASLAIPWGDAKAAIDSGRFDQRIAASVNQASDLDARGTPQFFLNGYRLKGAQPLERFEAVFAERLAAARALVAAGTPRSQIYARTMADAKGPTAPETKTLPPPRVDSPWRGAVNAPVVIQVFADFQCPFCARLRPTLAELERAYPGKLKIVWRHLPLSFHEDAALAAEAAQEAFAQRGSAGFWSYHDALFEQQRGAGLGRAELERLAAAQGLDLARFRAALDARTHKPTVEADAAVAKAAGITGTPTSVVGRFVVSGAQPVGAFSRAVDRALGAP